MTSLEAGRTPCYGFIDAMAARNFLLCALLPPGSVEAEVGGVQAALFADHGLASAQAVPPLVPIAFLEPARLKSGLLSRLNDAAPPGWRVRLQGAEWVEGHLYARIDSGGAWPALRAHARAECGLDSGGLFPVAEGFYLGCADAPEEARSGMRPRLPTRSFGSGTLLLMVLEPARPGPEWWSELHWEITEERPLRGRRVR